MLQVYVLYVGAVYTMYIMCTCVHVTLSLMFCVSQCLHLLGVTTFIQAQDMLVRFRVVELGTLVYGRSKKSHILPARFFVSLSLCVCVCVCVLGGGADDACM